MSANIARLATVAGFVRVVAVAALLACAGGAHAQTLTTAKLDAWLKSYGEAWQKRDPALATALFTENATYHEMPFDEPKKGRAGIRAYWAEVTANQSDVHFTAQTIAVNGDTAVAHWNAKFKGGGAPLELDGVFVLEFDAGGLCTSLREWWHLRE